MGKKATGLLGEPDVAGASRRRVTFSVEGAPVAKARPRFSSRGGRPRTYTPEKTVAYEARVRAAAVAAMAGAPPFQGPLVARITAYWPRLKSGPRALRSAPHAVRPDADNVAKAVLDALNGVVYADDAQVVDLRVTKARLCEGVGQDEGAVVVCVDELGP